MVKSRIKLNLQGINEVMKSPEIQAAVEEAGKAVANKCGQDYDTKSGTIKYIAFCNVFPNTKKAAKDNSENNTLIKSLPAVGLKTSKR